MWLLIVTIIVFNVIFLFMPKRLSSIEIFSTCMFAMVLQQIVDLGLDLKLDWYGYFKPGVQWAYFLVIVGVYPAVNAIFLNYYQWMKSRSQKLWYVAGCSVFAVAYECVASCNFGFFYHNEWKLWHSAMGYPFLYLILIFVLKGVRRMLQTEKMTSA